MQQSHVMFPSRQVIGGIYIRLRLRNFEINVFHHYISQWIHMGSKKDIPESKSQVRVQINLSTLNDSQKKTWSPKQSILWIFTTTQAMVLPPAPRPRHTSVPWPRTRRRRRRRRTRSRMPWRRCPRQEGMGVGDGWGWVGMGGSSPLV